MIHINHDPNLWSQSAQYFKKEVNFLIDNMYRKFKEYVKDKLKYGEYRQFSKDYRNAVTTCEELFKRKIGISLEA